MYFIEAFRECFDNWQTPKREANSLRINNSPSRAANQADVAVGLSTQISQEECYHPLVLPQCPQELILIIIYLLYCLSLHD